jgi:type I restriction enzyme S subunit
MKNGVRYRSYPRYKDSGAEWFGQIPDHWQIKRLRTFLKDGYDGLKIGPFGSQIRSDSLFDSGHPIYGQENVIKCDFQVGKRFVDDQMFRELSVYQIKPGDLLITMMGSSGRCVVAPAGLRPGIMDSHLIRLRFKEELRHAFAQILIDQAPYVEFQLLVLGKGSIMHGLNSTIIKQIELLAPPPSEQEAIITFIDRETAKIDELIAKK